MQYRNIDWNSPGNYDLFWVIIGAILFGLLLADFIWIYYKFSKKDSEPAPQNKTAYNQRRILGHI
jgi:cytochrome bd-type quinol oxidase subunit 2